MKKEINKDEAERLLDAKKITKDEFQKSYPYLTMREIAGIYRRAERFSVKEIKECIDSLPA